MYRDIYSRYSFFYKGDGPRNIPGHGFIRIGSDGHTIDTGSGGGRNFGLFVGIHTRQQFVVEGDLSVHP
jgi:hypothetical protein